MILANYRPRILPEVITLISRELPGEGPIIAQVGQEVSPSDILGLSVTTAGFRIVNIAKSLGVSPKDGLKFLQKDLGQSIFRGEPLAVSKAIFKKTINSPTDGVLQSYDVSLGNLKIGYLPDRQKISAAVYGIIQKIDPGKRQVVIKTEVSEVLGVLGSGRVREGNLTFLGGRGVVTNAKSITPKLTDHIVVAGGLIYKEALREAVAISVKGIIVGGINALDYKSMAGGTLVKKRSLSTDVGLSLLVTEGFGSFPIGEDIFTVLLKYSDKFVVLDGNGGRLLLPSFDSASMDKIRTTALPAKQIDLMLRPAIEVGAEELKVGMKVRVVSSPFTSEQGKVISIDKLPTKLPSGLLTYLSTIESKSRKIKVPVANIEIIG